MMVTYKQKQARKGGFTLIELLVVIAIMGILSSMGVVGLQGAVQNNRIKSAALEVSAYMERAASEANRLNESVCMALGVVGTDVRTLRLYKGACDNTKTLNFTSNDGVLDVLTLDSPVNFVAGPTPDSCTILEATGSSTLGVNFTPKLGLSAVPTGCLVMQYGSTQKLAAAVKYSNKNKVVAKISYDNGNSWSDL